MGFVPISGGTRPMLNEATPDEIPTEPLPERYQPEGPGSESAGGSGSGSIGELGDYYIGGIDPLTVASMIMFGGIVTFISVVCMVVLCYNFVLKRIVAGQ